MVRTMPQYTGPYNSHTHLDPTLYCPAHRGALCCAVLWLQLNQALATEEKEKGNKAFSDKKYDEAIKAFTKCIELDPE